MKFDKNSSDAALRIYAWARAEHAFMLRCEGHTLKQIAVRLGLVSKEQPRRLIAIFSRRLGKSMVRTKWYIMQQK